MNSRRSRFDLPPASFLDIRLMDETLAPDIEASRHGARTASSCQRSLVNGSGS
jgi:hypothetical protein